MPARFSPNGFLDVAADPSDLPAEVAGKVVTSGAMVRCTNLHLDRMGIASTRRGSQKVSATQLSTPIWRIAEMGGVRYEFAGAIIYRNETSIATGMTSARWSAVKYNAYNVATQAIFALNGTNRKRVEGSSVYEWGIAAPSAAPTMAGQGAGYAYTHDWEKSLGHAPGNSFKFGTTRNGYTCTYDWEQAEASGDSETYRHMWFFEQASSYKTTSRIGVKYTYLRKSGTTIECESNPSSPAYVEANTMVYATWVASSDSQVTHVRLYRTLEGGATFYYSNEYAVGDLSGACTKADTSLGAEVATDHDRPPLGTAVIGPDFGGYLFIAKDNLLYFCKPNQPEYWPALYYIEVSPPQDPIKSLALINGQVYALTQSEVYLVQGTGYQSFFPLRQAAKTGTRGVDGALGIKGQGVLHVASDGLWGFSGIDDDNLTNSNFRPIFQGTARGSIPAATSSNMANCWLLQHKGKLYFGWPDSTATYPTDLIVTDMATKRPVHYEYGKALSAVCVDETNDRILAGDSDGYVWILEDASIATDGGTAITYDWESMEASDQVRRYFPRYAKYDVEVGSAATCAGQVILDDAVKQSHTLTGSRNTKKRHVTHCNGNRLRSRVTGTGTVSLYAAEVE